MGHSRVPFKKAWLLQKFCKKHQFYIQIYASVQQVVHWDRHTGQEIRIR